MTCTPKFTPAYTDLVRGTFIREWLRLTGGDAALDDYDRRVAGGEAIKVPAEVGDRIDTIIDSMKTGTVPGMWQDADGKCYQDWTVTACFARWYHAADDTLRADIQQQVEQGNTTPWVALKVESAASPCVADAPPSKDCCPAAVWADPVYLQLSDATQQAGWSLGAILGFSLIGAGVTWLLLKKGRK